ncbi:MAG TPA: FtsX-like permease family protein, partial [Vicinamibacterales bacterium]
ADLRQPLLMLWGAVGIVLLVACVNLAGLLLARASGRAREIATRMALGSGRSAIVRQLLVESVVLAMLGAAAGLALGHYALAALQALADNVFELWQPASLDARAVAVACALALVASVLFGLVPALHATRLDVQAAMAESGARSVAGAANRWPRRVIVVAQVALGVVLLVGAGLLFRTFSHLRHLEPGFDPNGVTTVSLSLQDARYQTGERVVRIFDETLRRISETAGVDSAAVALGVPYERLLNMGFRYLDGPLAGSPDGKITNATYVSPDYFRALRIPLLAGRAFDQRDRKDSPGVVIVSHAFAQRYFDDGNAMGHRIRVMGMEREIVGVVGDVQVKPSWGDSEPLTAQPLAYMPATQVNDGTLKLIHGWFSPTFIVRAAGTTEATARTVRAALDASDPLLPIAEVRSMAEVQAASIAQQRFLLVLLAVLAGATVLLGAIGIHGLIATSVTERTREMGIRIALGATRSRALRTLAAPGITLAAIGVVVGAGAALAAARLLRAFVFGVSTTDPLTFVAVSVVLLAVATVSSVVPALRVLRVQPSSALRAQ